MHEHTEATTHIGSKEFVRGFQYAFMILFVDPVHGRCEVVSFMVTDFVSENHNGRCGKCLE